MVPKQHEDGKMPADDPEKTGGLPKWARCTELAPTLLVLPRSNAFVVNWW